MAICNKCGAEISNTDQFCPSCGSAQQPDSVPEPVIAPASTPTNSSTTADPSLGEPPVYPLILGILSLVMLLPGIFGIPTYVIGLVLSIVGLCLGNKNIRIYGQSAGILTAAHVCNIVGIILNSILLFLFISIIGCVGCMAMIEA